MLLYHGQGTSGDLGEIVDHDLVITTYETLLLKSPILKKISWFRIVLDEGRNILTGTLKDSYIY